MDREPHGLATRRVTNPATQPRMCARCKHWHAMTCLNPAAPWGGKPGLAAPGLFRLCWKIMTKPKTISVGEQIALLARAVARGVQVTSVDNSGCAPGHYDVTLRNPDGERAILDCPLEVALFAREAMARPIKIFTGSPPCAVMAKRD